MKTENVRIGSHTIPFTAARAAVVGSGAASLNAAVHLKRLGMDDVSIITAGMGDGTSANAGSDKQTYYRLNPAGNSSDSVRSMADDLWSGGAMHGDIALIEAALSTREFYHLVELGVPFPHDRYGNYAGFITDHDRRSRGTSAGPRTSIIMFEKLREEAARLGIPVIDGAEVVEIVAIPFKGGKKAAGLIALDRSPSGKNPFGLRAVAAEFIVYGTGGPGALYADSAYPLSQAGSLGAALKAGAAAHNLTESQFGLASKEHRWNLSGSYQQVLPRYFSVGPDGSDEYEFLAAFFPTPEIMLRAQFLKGYQWPFDIRKIADFGSSCIDLLVWYERHVRGRKVYMDFRVNPRLPGMEFSLDILPASAAEYLGRSGALSSRPVDRLKAMNLPAYELFLSKGIDLAERPLDVALCHQHLNGGLRADTWWESNIRNFFPVGEVCGTHGIYRPGGSALNAGQVGSLRAAQMMARRAGGMGWNPADAQTAAVRDAIRRKIAYIEGALSRGEKADIGIERAKLQSRMSAAMGVMRDPGAIESALAGNRAAVGLHRESGIAVPGDAPAYLKNEDLLLTERFFLESARALTLKVRGGRGSWCAGSVRDIFRADETGAVREIRVTPGGGACETMILEIFMTDDGRIETSMVPARPVPESEPWFETTWAEFRGGRIFGEEP